MMMIDLSHYSVKACSTYSDRGSWLEAECDRCPRWYLPGEEHDTYRLLDLLTLLGEHERQAHGLPDPAV